MPCNAKVVVKATVGIDDMDKFIQTLKSNRVSVTEAGDRFILTFGRTVRVDVFKSGKAEIKSNAATWDEGVKEINLIMKWLITTGIDFKEIGQPETHRHDHVAPWQKRGIHG